jgi:hypothetical protein
MRYKTVTGSLNCVCQLHTYISSQTKIGKALFTGCCQERWWWWCPSHPDQWCWDSPPGSTCHRQFQDQRCLEEESHINTYCNRQPYNVPGEIVVIHKLIHTHQTSIGRNDLVIGLKNLTSMEVVHADLCQHSVVLNLRFPERRAVVCEDNQLAWTKKQIRLFEQSHMLHTTNVIT